MDRVELRCLGDVEFRLASRRLDRFESQKTKALLVYLALHHRQALSRDMIAGLLWPESPNDSARRNLRQALYNLRLAFNGTDPDLEGCEVLISDRHEVRLSPELDLWIDVEAFEAALDESERRDVADPQRLMEAVSLYRGEFLTGLQLEEAEEFEFWLLSQQERLRELVMSALGELTRSYFERGAYRLGLPYAQRLVALDPLSEEARRNLMELYWLSGRRSSALRQYEELETVLRQELGVAPSPKPLALRDRILRGDEAPPETSSPAGGGIGPVIPLVGRSQALSQLEESMDSAFAGESCLTLIKGEPGVGKSRLIKSFLGSIPASDHTVVLKSRCSEEIPILLSPFTQLVESAFEYEEPDSEFRRRCSDLLPTLGFIAPGVIPWRQDSPPTPLPETTAARVLAALFIRMAQEAGVYRGRTGKLIIFLDALEAADPAALRILLDLHRRLRSEELPVWIVAAFTDTGLESEHPLAEPAGSPGEQGAPAVVDLQPLDDRLFDEIGTALVAVKTPKCCREFLKVSSSGLPLEIAEWINYLWDEGLLDRGPRSVAPLCATGPEHDRIGRRRRPDPAPLATASIFDPKAGDPGSPGRGGVRDPCPVDRRQRATRSRRIAMQTLIERWIVRRFRPDWQKRDPQRDAVLWSQGAHQGEFEFASKLTRTLLAFAIGPDRRKVLHGDLARAIETVHASHLPDYCEVLGYHHHLAENHEQAWGYLRSAGDRARAVCARETALDYYQKALTSLEIAGPMGKKPYKRDLQGLRARIRSVS